MSFRCIRWAIEAPKTKSPVERHVLLVLANFANEAGWAWPSTAKIATITKLSVRTVQRAVRGLVRCGDIVSVTPGGGRKSNRYLLHQSHPKGTGEEGARQSAAPVGATGQSRQSDGAATAGSQGTPVTETDDPSDIPDLIHQGTSAARRQRDVHRASPARSDVEQRFLRFWAVYPRKDAKKAARDAWARIAPDDRQTDEIVAAVRRHATTKQWQDPQYVPYASTYLKDARWEDASEVAAATPEPRHGTVPDVEETRRYLDELRGGR